MKLKLVVASMSVLGLVNCPVFADTQTKGKHQKVNHPVVTHHHVVKHHHRHVVREPMHEEMVQSDYKGEIVHPAPVAVCTVSESAMILDAMTQNLGRAVPNPCNPGWFNRISLSGGLNLDIGKWGDRNTNYMGVNYQRFSLNDAYINLGANVNDWVKAFGSISFNTATINDPSFATPSQHFAEYDAAYSNNLTSGSSNNLQLEQASVTVGNFEVSPFFLQFGKQFQDFSRYEIHPITESMTEVMSKTLATSVKLGFIADGFNGSIYVFDDPLPKVGHSTHHTNYGAALGFESPCEELGYDLGVAYLYNLVGVNDTAYAINQFNIANTAVATDGYNSRVGGLAVYGDVNSGPFYLGARYTTALQRFNVADLPRNGIADLSPTVPLTGTPLTSAQGAKPWSVGGQVGFGFTYYMERSQNVYVGYQTSRQAAGLLLPRYRWQSGYNIEVVKNANLGIEYDYDKAYGIGQGGTGKNSDLVTLRAAVKFG